MIQVSHPPVLLADYTTLGLGGPAKIFVSADTERALIHAVRSADKAGEPALLIGGGSNLVIADAGFPGTVIHVNTRGLTFVDAGDGAVNVTVAAGADWDDVVAAAVGEGLAGLEPLSGIPGRAGATPIQNVGAYGREVAEVITEVRVYDRQEDQIRLIPNEGCRFSYRTSLFKSGRPEALVSLPGSARSQTAGQPRYVVLDVTFRLVRQSLSAPVRYAELAAELGVELGEQAAVGEVRAAVIKIRSRKGMVLNPGDPDTRSAGSFFTNPVLTAEEFAARRDRRGRQGRRPGAALPGGRGPGQGSCRLADRALRLRQGLRRPWPGARLVQAHPRAGQRGRGDDGRSPGTGPRDRLRRPCRLRRHSDPGANPHRRHPLTAQVPVASRHRLAASRLA